MTTFRIALAGNPNTGKSTLFNALTGMRQHTGNWPGKTVLQAVGHFEYQDNQYELIDLPGTYSLYSNSTDEEVARDYIIFEKPDVTVVVMDATSLERNMNLALQVLEMTSTTVICINLMDEAKKKGITIDTARLEEKLGVPVVKISARNRKGFNELFKALEEIATGDRKTKPYHVSYSETLEEKIAEVEEHVKRIFGNEFPSRWIALRIIDGDEQLLQSLKQHVMKQRGEVEHEHGRAAEVN
ncbi:FeoB small GTPase domain-containing protein [Bacillus tianshenii]|nr:FeoB small GTPase domain-containing protein [Bacillus tianshenii]